MSLTATTPTLLLNYISLGNSLSPTYTNLPGDVSTLSKWIGSIV